MIILIEIREENRIYYQFKAFKEIDYINHLFTSRIGWEHSDQAALSNIFKTSRKKIIALKQVHGTNILHIDREEDAYDEIRRTEADGLITNLPKIVLTTYHADCVPLFFLDRLNKAIGMAHAGWRGTFENMAGKMVENMKAIYGSDARDILVGIGPAIGKCCYEVGRDVKDKFFERYVEFPDIIENRNGSFYLDLWKVNLLQLKKAGIPEENIILSNTCTSCKVDKFYSYRREKGSTGRMIAAISLTE